MKTIAKKIDNLKRDIEITQSVIRRKSRERDALNLRILKLKHVEKHLEQKLAAMNEQS